VGLPAEEKVILITAIAAAVGSYVWGIIDSYNGAKRYNTKLLTVVEPKLEFELADAPEVGLSLRFRW
jgi:hypothetical protein